MKNAAKYGLLIGIISGIWIFIMHLSGVYERPYPLADKISWMEFAAVLIPLTGLYLGIKSFRDNYNGGKMEFFEGLFEGFKILLVGGVITAFFGVLYVQYMSSALQADFMGRIAGAGLVGILFNIVMALILMNKQRNL